MASPRTPIAQYNAKSTNPQPHIAEPDEPSDGETLNSDDDDDPTELIDNVDSDPDYDPSESVDGDSDDDDDSTPDDDSDFDNDDDDDNDGDSAPDIPPKRQKRGDPQQQCGRGDSQQQSEHSPQHQNGRGERNDSHQNEEKVESTHQTTIHSKDIEFLLEHNIMVFVMCRSMQFVIAPMFFAPQSKVVSSTVVPSTFECGVENIPNTNLMVELERVKNHQVSQLDFFEQCLNGKFGCMSGKVSDISKLLKCVAYMVEIK